MNCGVDVGTVVVPWDDNEVTGITVAALEVDCSCENVGVEVLIDSVSAADVIVTAVLD